MEYMNELELKTLIIRIQKAHKHFNTLWTGKTLFVNTKENVLNNRKINKYVRWYKDLSNKKYASVDLTKKKLTLLKKLKNVIISKSENTPIDKRNYEYFGICIMKMVDKILTKPQFRNYSYYDDFMSDSNYKILKYIDNFDHTKISSISNQAVNAFAYISTIIHNAIIFIINKHKKEKIFIDEQIAKTRIDMGWNVNVANGMYSDIKNFENKESSNYDDSDYDENIEHIFINSDNFVNTIEFIKDCLNDKNKEIEVIYDELMDLDELHAIYDIKENHKNGKNVKIIKGDSEIFNKEEI